MGILPVPSALSPGVILVASACVPIKKCFFVFYRPTGLVDKSLWLSELGVLGAHPLSGSLKSWGTQYVFQTFHSSEKSNNLGVLFQFRGKALCQGWGLRWDHFSAFPTCLDVGIFSFTQVRFWLLLAVCSCTFGASMAGGKFRNLICHHLGSSQRESNSTYPVEWFRE